MIIDGGLTMIVLSPMSRKCRVSARHTTGRVVCALLLDVVFLSVLLSCSLSPSSGTPLLTQHNFRCRKIESDGRNQLRARREDAAPPRETARGLDYTRQRE